MSGDELPMGLSELDRMLALRRRPDPPSALRGTVLAALRMELRRERFLRRLELAGMAAAMALLWLNLAWSATLATRFDILTCHSARELAAPLFGDRPMVGLERLLQTGD